MVDSAVEYNGRLIETKENNDRFETNKIIKEICQALNNFNDIMTYQLFFIKSNFLFSEVWLMLQVFLFHFFSTTWAGFTKKNRLIFEKAFISFYHKFF